MKKGSEILLKQFAKGKSNEVKDLGVQNCVIYTRVSSKEQMDTNQSLEWQKKYCVEYAIKNKLEVRGFLAERTKALRVTNEKSLAVCLNL